MHYTINVSDLFTRNIFVFISKSACYSYGEYLTCRWQVWKIIFFGNFFKCKSTEMSIWHLCRGNIYLEINYIMNIFSSSRRPLRLANYSFRDGKLNVSGHIKGHPVIYIKHVYSLFMLFCVQCDIISDQYVVFWLNYVFFLSNTIMATISTQYWREFLNSFSQVKHSSFGCHHEHVYF